MDDSATPILTRPLRLLIFEDGTQSVPRLEADYDPLGPAECVRLASGEPLPSGVSARGYDLLLVRYSRRWPEADLLRWMNSNPRLPVVIVTGPGETPAGERILRCGAVAHLAVEWLARPGILIMLRSLVMQAAARGPLARATPADTDLRPVLRSAGPILVLAPDRRVLFINDAARQLLPEVDGEIVVPFPISPGNDIEVAGAAAKSVLGVRTEEIEWRGQPAFVATLEDRSAQRRVEKALARTTDELHHSQRVVLVGNMASRAAHDLNNQLQAVVGFCEQMLRTAGESTPLRSQLELVCRAGESAGGLVRRMLRFSRKHARELETIEMDELLRGLEPLLLQLLGDAVELRLQIGASGARVRADRVELEQVLANLAANARDAMSEGGALSIVTGPAPALGGPSAGVPRVSICFEDTGCGMAPETLERAFEPYFTTKPENLGTGLGLSSVKAIVRSAGGEVLLSSEVGQGTRIELLLPQVAGAAAPGSHEPSPSSPMPLPSPVPLSPPASLSAPPPSISPALPPPLRLVEEKREGAETVLLVEDGESVRQLLNELLVDAGYRVCEAADAEAALRLCRDFSDPIDLLVTDVSMPGMSGLELARELRRRRPKMKLLFVSGYLDPDCLGDSLLSRSDRLLHKPFKPGELLQRVRSILDSPARSSGSPASR